MFLKINNFKNYFRNIKFYTIKKVKIFNTNNYKYKLIYYGYSPFPKLIYENGSIFNLFNYIKLTNINKDIVYFYNISYSDILLISQYIK